MKKMYVGVALAALVVVGIGHAQDIIHVNDAAPEAATPGRVKPEYVLYGMPLEWSSGRVDWYYNPLYQPSYLTTASVFNSIQLAIDRWSRVCNLTFNYKGITTSTAYIGLDSSKVANQNVFGWGIPSAGANLYDASLWYDSINARLGFGSIPLAVADLVLDPTKNWAVESVDGAYTAALGKFIGIRPSNVSWSILYAGGQTSTYMRTLRGDDADACAAMYGAAASAGADRALNWAEATYPQILQPSPAHTDISNDGSTLTRNYPGSHTSVSITNGVVSYTGPDGVVQNMGPLSNYSYEAKAAGF